jgi:hypothetical protein
VGGRAWVELGLRYRKVRVLIVYDQEAIESQ